MPSIKKIPIRRLSKTQQVNSFAETFKIRRVEDILNGQDLNHELHRHDFFFILILQKGAGTHNIDFVSHDLEDYSISFLRPGQVHELKMKAASKGYLLEFAPGFYTPKQIAAIQRLRKASNKNYCKLDKNRFNNLVQLLDFIFNEHAAKEEGYQDFIESCLDLFFIELLRQSPHPKSETSKSSPYNQERYEEFLELVNKHLTTHKQVPYYTNLMNLSAYQLNEITKLSVAKTASELITEQIILEAKRQLLATPNQVKDIADHLGYEDTSYFIRFFKKQTGISPEAFRRNLK